MLLAPLRRCFATAHTFETFRALLAGMLAGTGERTVCAMLTGAGLARAWPHDRAHHFFSGAAWPAEALGLALAQLVVELLVPPGAAVEVALDDTLYRRSGPQVWAADFFHDGSATDARKVGYGNTWVILGIVVRPPWLTRPLCLPVMARLVRKDTTSASRLWLGVQMASALARALPGRRVKLAADGAYAGGELQSLPPQVSVVTTVRKDAALHELPPPPTGRPGRPAQKGAKLPKLSQLAAALPFTPATVTRYGHTGTAYVATRQCLWPSVFGYAPATLVLVRNKPGIPRGGYDKAFITPATTATATAATDTTTTADPHSAGTATDTDATGTAHPDSAGVDTTTATRAVEGYAGRWSEEMCQPQCTHIREGPAVAGWEAAPGWPGGSGSAQRRRVYQPGGRARRWRSSASSPLSACRTQRCGGWDSWRPATQPRRSQEYRVTGGMPNSAARSGSHHSPGPGCSPGGGAGRVRVGWPASRSRRVTVSALKGSPRPRGGWKPSACSCRAIAVARCPRLASRRVRSTSCG